MALLARIGRHPADGDEPAVELGDLLARQLPRLRFELETAFPPAALDPIDEADGAKPPKALRLEPAQPLELGVARGFAGPDDPGAAPHVLFE